MSNDVSKINKDGYEAQTMDVKAIGNGQPDENSSPVVVNRKSVTDTSDEKSQADINTAKLEEPVPDKHDRNGSSSPVKRKQVMGKSDSESEDHGSPKKKPRSDAAEHLSDEEHAGDSTRMSGEDIDSSAEPSPKKQKSIKRTAAYYTVKELEPGLLEQPIILEEGQKREKKKVQRLEVTPPSVKKHKRLSLEEGSGTKLGDIPRVEFQLQRKQALDLKPLHTLLFDRAFTKHMELKRNIRQFSGFTFSADSDQRKKKVDKLTSKYTLAMLRSICETLDIERVGKKEDIIERIVNFLMEPKESGKPMPTVSKKTKKRRRSSKSKEGDANEGSAEKTKVKKSKSKKAKESGAENDAGDGGKKAAATGSDAEIDKSDDAEISKPAKKKKKDATPAKRTPKAEKKTPKSSSAKKAKKPRKKSKASSGGISDDDSESLVKKKVPPTDDMLKSVVKKILKTANLEEVTMKTVCKQVYDKFPDFDLTSRKDFIKATVKQILR